MLKEFFNMKFDFKDIMSLLMSKIFVILLALFIFAGAGFAYTYFFVEPTYTASVKLLARNKEATGSVSSSDIVASQNLANTCITILESDDFLDKVSALLESRYTGITNSYIKNHMVCKKVPDTEILTVRIKTPDAKISYDIAQAIGNLAPDIIPQTITMGELRKIDSARLPKNSSWPVAQNSLIAGVIGAIAVCAIIIIRAMLDTTIRSKKDLEDKFDDIPVIGTIPGISRN